MTTESNPLPPTLFKKIEPDPPEALEKHRLEVRQLPREDPYALSATQQLSAIVAVAVLASIVSYSQVCQTVQKCIDGGTCIRSNLTICAASNIVSLASDAAAGTDVGPGTLPALLQGVCAPGDVMRSSSSGTECVPFFPFPDSVNRAIMDEGATAPHEKACGKWLRSGGVILDGKPIYRSLGDHENWLAALKEAEEKATKDSRLASSPMSKFRALCERTTTAGPTALRASAVQAFEYLRQPIEEIETHNDVLRATGHLAAHFCDGPIKIGVYLHLWGLFVSVMMSGTRFDSGALAESLFVVDAGEDAIREASDANDALNGIKNAPILNITQASEIFFGATGKTTENATLTGYDLSIVSAVAMLDPSVAKSYLRGVAAFCVFSTQSQVQNMEAGAANEMRSRIRKEGVVSGTFFKSKERDPFEELDNETVSRASSVTFSMVGPDSASSCIDFMRVRYTDHVDEARFNTIYHGDLYDRIEFLVHKARKSVADVVQRSPIAEALASPASVAEAVMTTRVKIAGAPRNTWAGLDRPLPTAAVTSDDGLFLVALKQANAVFYDRIVLDIYDHDACEHVPFDPAETANAYALPTMRCNVYFLGLSHRPWLDHAYSDSSIAGRSLHVFSHELAHNTISRGFRRQQYIDLLQDYEESTHAEAIADLIAILAVMDTNLTNTEDLIINFCASWCARTPLLYLPPSSSHPLPNERCDRLVSTLQRLELM